MKVGLGLLAGQHERLGDERLGLHKRDEAEPPAHAEHVGEARRVRTESDVDVAGEPGLAVDEHGLPADDHVREAGVREGAREARHQGLKHGC